MMTSAASQSRDHQNFYKFCYLPSSSPLKPMASPIRSLRPALSLAHLAGPASRRPLTPPAAGPRLHVLTPRLSFRCRSGGESSIGTVEIVRAEEKKQEEAKKRGRACVRLCLGAQVRFGERVAVVGSSEELGLWREPVAMEWTEAGWVCELSLRGGEDVEFKFVVQDEGRKGMVWEEGGNRVLAVPGSGDYDLVCGWNSTGEAIDLLARAREEALGGEQNGAEATIDDLWVAAVAKTGPFLSNVSDEIKIKSSGDDVGGGGNSVKGDGVSGGSSVKGDSVSGSSTIKGGIVSDGNSVDGGGGIVGNSGGIVSGSGGITRISSVGDDSVGGGSVSAVDVGGVSAVDVGGVSHVDVGGVSDADIGGVSDAGVGGVSSVGGVSDISGVDDISGVSESVGGTSDGGNKTI